MRLVRWQPINRDFNALADRFNRVFDLRHWDEDDRESLGHWHPAVDIFDNGTEIVLEAELPGLKKDEIDVKVDNNVMTLQGERKREKEVEENGYFRSERSYGSFSRSFTLPTTVDSNKIEAAFEDGVLKVTLPKAEEAKPKQIEVKVA